jgi:hypothetical protein
MCPSGNILGVRRTERILWRTMASFIFALTSAFAIAGAVEWQRCTSSAISFTNQMFPAGRPTLDVLAPLGLIFGIGAAILVVTLRSPDQIGHLPDTPPSQLPGACRLWTRSSGTAWYPVRGDEPRFSSYCIGIRRYGDRV